MVQTWCKRTTLASLVLWYDKQGERFRSLSELVRAALEGMEEIIRQNGEIVVENIDEAEEVLKAFKLRNLNPGGKGRRNLYNNLAKASSLGTSKEIENAREIRRIIEKNFLKHVKVSKHFVSYSTIKRFAYRVLERGIYPYSKIAQLALEYLRENTLALLSRYEANAEVLRDLKLRLWDYKLYEVYVFYVMTYAILQELLKEKSVPLIAGLYSNEALITVNLGNKIKVLYDRSIPCSSWISHGKYSIFNGDEINIPSGRPDITIQISSSVIAVCDAKYRISAAELSEARFKVLGYMHEYSAPIGVLVFDPQHLMSKEVLDEEIREDIELMDRIRKYRGILIENKNKSFYIVALSPVRHTELIETREYRLLKDLCSKLIHYLH